MKVFLDTEFSNFMHPRLLSIGLVTLEEPIREIYLELDLSTLEGQARRRAANDFVKSEVLPLWGRVPRARVSLFEMCRRIPAWLDELATSGVVEVLFDYQ